MATVNYNEQVQSQFAEDLKAVAQPPISDTELSKAYKHYGVSTGKAEGQNDAQLFRRATNDVLAWWKTAKTQGYYNSTNGAGTPMGQSGNKPPQAPLPVFGRAYMDSVRKQYGLLGVPVPNWATANQQRFERWLRAQLQRKGLTLNENRGGIRRQRFPRRVSE